MENKALPAGYIPKDQRKKILLLSDDLRMPSGVGVMSREIVLGTAHHFNWVQLGGAVHHPEQGQCLDASESLNGEIGIPDSSVRIYPYTGYGDFQILQHLLTVEKPDAILHFTDPRFWIWLYHLEREIRTKIPILFYHVWDDTPFPKYNENYYRSCDWISCISKQTYNIVKQVWKKQPSPNPWQIKYIPHGINPKTYYKITDTTELEKITALKKQFFGTDDVKFVVLYNNRNIRRKMTGDVILAYQQFVNNLPKQDADKCRLLLHTQKSDDNGTDLEAVIRDCAPDIKYAFSEARVPFDVMNQIYSLSDVVINLASNEGFGLGTAEALMAERMIVVNVTGGLQDQCGFIDEDMKFLDPDIHYGADWGTNADGKYRMSGPWVIPCFPTQRGLIGSPPTPYIFDDRCSWSDAATALRKIYDMTPDERAENGRLGREYVMTEGFSSEEMCKRFMDGINETLEKFTPREQFTLIKA